LVKHQILAAAIKKISADDVLSQERLEWFAIRGSSLRIEPLINESR
jgi:hypothetical protein